LGVAFGVGFGVASGFAVAFGTGVSLGVGFGNSISLFISVKDGRSFSVSSGFNGSDSMDGAEIFGGDDALLSDFSASRSSAPLNQTKLSASGALRAAKLQRINPAISATCARAISVTFRQKRGVFDIYFDSARVAMPTFVICACFSASISAINFWTGNSRSGRITTATSGFICFNSVSRAASAFKSIT
jgi:hypothetical protein